MRSLSEIKSCWMASVPPVGDGIVVLGIVVDGRNLGYAIRVMRMIWFLPAVRKIAPNRGILLGLLTTCRGQHVRVMRILHHTF